MFRRIVKKVLTPVSMIIIALGIVALCQPWMLGLHRRGFLITAAGLVLFIVFSHFKPPVEEAVEETTDTP
jgi:type IV secretory pathway VirB2 component (pilin)